MKITQKIKQTARTHKDELIAGTIVLGTIAVTYFVATKQQEYVDALNARVDEFVVAENAKGRAVVMLADGSLLSIDPNA